MQMVSPDRMDVAKSDSNAQIILPLSDPDFVPYTEKLVLGLDHADDETHIDGIGMKLLENMLESSASTDLPNMGPSDRDAPGNRTTLMLKNLPMSFHRDDVVALLNDHGFMVSVNFIYMPLHFAFGTSFGYAFVNIVSNEEARCIWDRLEGFWQWSSGPGNKCVVVWSQALQGLDANVARYMNSRLMHPSVPDVIKPAIYCNGIRVPFPAPTKPVQRPRRRQAVKNSAS